MESLNSIPIFKGIHQRVSSREQSGLYYVFFKNDSGCSLDNATTNVHSMSMDLPYLGNKNENGRKLEAIMIIKARNGIGLDQKF